MLRGLGSAELLTEWTARPRLAASAGRCRAVLRERARKSRRQRPRCAALSGCGRRQRLRLRIVAANAGEQRGLETLV